MRYHNITKDDMLNGDGLRVVLWVSGCNHCCEECQNPITWDPNGGIPFNQEAKNELFEELGKSYVSGITLSGGQKPDRCGDERHFRAQHEHHFHPEGRKQSFRQSRFRGQAADGGR